MAQAEFVLAHHLKTTVQQMEQMQTKLPNLTRFKQDAGDLGRQLDSLSTGSLTNIGNAFGDIAAGTTTITAGVQSMEQQFIKSLANMAIQIAILRPLADGLRNSLMFAIPSLGPTAGAVGGSTGSTIGTVAATSHSGGIVGSEHGAPRYVHPAYFDDAPRLHSGGIAGDEVPIVARRGEGVFTPGQMRALAGGQGGGGTQVNIINQAPGVSVAHQSRSQGGVDVHDLIISSVNSSAASGALDATLRARMGLKVPPRSR